MKVVLIKDVRHIGRSGEVIEVSDGHAINFLIPNKSAIAATSQAVAQSAFRQKLVKEQQAMDAGLLQQNLATLSEKPLVIKMKANDKGHLYEAVGASEIVAAAHEAHIEIPEEVIKLEKPIKEVGTFEVPVSSGKDFGSFSVVIEAL